MGSRSRERTPSSNAKGGSERHGGPGGSAAALAERHLSAGRAAITRGDFNAAIDAYKRAIAANPKSAVAHNDLANAYRSVWRLDEALAGYKRAIELDSEFGIAHFNLGVTLLDAGMAREALPILTRALGLRPAHAGTAQSLILAFKKLGRLAEAEPLLGAFQRQAARAPQSAEALVNHALALAKFERVSEAAEALEKAVAADPRDADTLGLLGMTRLEELRYDDALSAFDRALVLRPDDAAIRFYRALELLRAGDYARGFAEYEWRWKHLGFSSPRRHFPQPLWNGGALAGGTILLHTEQGLGDALQFIRYAELVKRASGATVVVECERPLSRLFERAAGVDQVVIKGEPLPAFDAHAPLLSLPHLTGTGADAMPATVPYLDLAGATSPVLPPRRMGARLRVGIVWAGSATHVNNLNRSVPLRHFDALIARDDVEIVSLQKGEALEELLTHPRRGWMVEAGSRCGDFLDTAAVMRGLDLVISVDTAPAHLAGALGVPVWVLLPANADWRWGTSRDDSPWYPTARLFRQRTPGDWSQVFARVAASIADAKSVVPAAPPDRAGAVKAFSAAVAKHTKGDLAGAAAGYRLALASDGTLAEAHNNLGVLLRNDGDLPAALMSFQAAIAARPDYSDALLNAGAAYRALGDAAAALPLLEAAVRLRPSSADGWSNIALARLRLGDPAGARTAIAAGRAGATRDPIGLVALGNAQLALGDIAAAEALFAEAVVLAPSSVEALNNLGHASYRRGDLSRAVELFRRAVQVDPTSVDALNNLGLTLRDLGETGEGERVLGAALALSPDAVQPLINLATIRADVGATADARALYERALAIEPKSPEALVGLGNCAADELRYAVAETWFARALNVSPGYPPARWNRGMVRLATGDLAGGWTDFEARWDLVEGMPNARAYAVPRWDGASLDGRTLLLHTEQGLGDTLQFIRFAREVKRRWRVRVLLECQPALAGLLANSGYLDAVIPQGSALPPFDAWLPLLSLPAMLGIEDPAPVDGPAYLRAPARAEPDGAAPAAGLKVGLVWGGRTERPRLAVRSLPLGALAPIADVPGVTLYSVQVGAPAAELSRVPFGGRIADLGRSLGDFADTAAAIAGLDLVITIDTSVAHLAGALGVPVWVLLPYAADWRWMAGGGGDATPWYPTARLFRQPARGDWSSVVRDLTDALRARAGAPAPDAGMARIPATQRAADGTPRFTVLVPFERLSTDPAAVSQVEREIVGGGVNAELRIFLDEQLRDGDVFVDIGAGLGFATLAAATIPGRRVRRVAIASGDADAVALRRSVAVNALAGAVEVATASPLGSAPLEALLAPPRHTPPRGVAPASRVFVHVADASELPALLAGSPGLIRGGRVAAMIWTCRRDDAGAVILADEMMLQGLGAFGYAHFSMIEGAAGAPELSHFPATPDATVIFSFSPSYLAACAAEGTTDDAAEPASPQVVAPSRPTLGFDWRLSPSTGWGVYGLNLALHALKAGGPMPLLFTPPDLDGLSAEQLETLAPALALHREVAETLRQHPQHRVSGDFTMLRSLANNLNFAVPSLAAEGRRNIGVVFFEDSRIDAGGIARGRRFDRIIAGSSWNANVLQAHGLDHTQVVLQGIDPKLFAPGPRAMRFGSRFVIFSGGKLEYRKGQDIVVAAFRAFRERHPEALLMVAWHNQWPQTMAEIETRGHVRGTPDVSANGRLDVVGWLAKNGVPADAVVDLGMLPNGEMGKMMREADVALFPNRCEGGTNLVAMEAMATGLPAILSANTGHLDVAHPAHSYLMTSQGPVTPTEAFAGVEGWGETSVDEAVAMLERVWSDRAEAGRRGRAASAAMHRLSWSAQIAKLLECVGN